jgi:hypothetical protein
VAPSKRAEQKAAIKKIDSLYQTTPDLIGEDKWGAAEAGLREGHREQMTGIDEAVVYFRCCIVYEGDRPLLDRPRATRYTPGSSLTWR